MTEQIAVLTLKTVTDYVAEHGSVTNRECRELTGLGYDSSIKIFGALCSLGTLRKVGESSGTKYVLAPEPKSVGKRLNQKIKIKHLEIVMDYVVKQGAITNRDFREVTGLSYNSAIRIFGALCSLGMLKKIGVSSTTKYLIATRSAPSPPRPGFHRNSSL